MKEKLIELLLSAEKMADEAGFFNCHKSRPKAKLIADYLIQNGVVVLPCEVGDTAWRIEIDFDDFGKTIFFTKEEAEKKLKENENVSTGNFV